MSERICDSLLDQELQIKIQERREKIEQLECTRRQLEMQIVRQKWEAKRRESQKVALQREFKRLERQKNVSRMLLQKFGDWETKDTKKHNGPAERADNLVSENNESQLDSITQELQEAYVKNSTPLHLPDQNSSFSRQYEDLTFFYTRLKEINRGKAYRMKQGEVARFAFISRHLVEHQLRLMHHAQTIPDDVQFESVSLDKYVSPQLLHDLIRGIIMLERTMKEREQDESKQRDTDSSRSTKWGTRVWNIVVDNGVMDAFSALLNDGKCDAKIAFLLSMVFRSCASEIGKNQSSLHWFRYGNGINVLIESLCTVLKAMLKDSELRKSGMHQRFCSNVLSTLNSLAQFSVLLPFIQDSIILRGQCAFFTVLPKVLVRTFIRGSNEPDLRDMRQRILVLLASLCRLPEYMPILERFMIGKFILASLCRAEFVRESVSCIVAMCRTRFLRVKYLNHMLHVLLALAKDTTDPRLYKIVARLLHDMIMTQNQRREILFGPVAEQFNDLVRALMQDDELLSQMEAATTPAVAIAFVENLRSACNINTDTLEDKEKVLNMRDVVKKVGEYIHANQLPYESIAVKEMEQMLSKQQQQKHFRSTSVAHMATPTRKSMRIIDRAKRSPVSLSAADAERSPTSVKLKGERPSVQALVSPSRLNKKNIEGLSAEFRAFKSKQILGARRRLVFDTSPRVLS